MANQDYYEFRTAYNPDAEQLQADAIFEVFAVTDLSRTTPLQVFAVDSGLPITPLRSNSIGMLPSFRVQGDPTQVIIRSGSFVTLLSSKYGFVYEAGLDPQTVQSAVTAAADAETAAEGAETAAGAASEAATAASQSATQAAAVGATNDTVIAGRIKDKNSQTTAALLGQFVLFLNKDGTPVQNKVVAITLSADGTEIDDIAVYDSVGEVGGP